MHLLGVEIRGLRHASSVLHATIVGTGHQYHLFGVLTFGLEGLPVAVLSDQT